MLDLDMELRRLERESDRRICAATAALWCVGACCVPGGACVVDGERRWG